MLREYLEEGLQDIADKLENVKKEYYKNNSKLQIIMGIVIAATVFTSGCIAFYNRKKHK